MGELEEMSQRGKFGRRKPEKGATILPFPTGERIRGHDTPERAASAAPEPTHLLEDSGAKLDYKKMLRGLKRPRNEPGARSDTFDGNDGNE